MPERVPTRTMFAAAMFEIQAVYECLEPLPQIVGPAYGANIENFAKAMLWPILCLRSSLPHLSALAGFPIPLARMAIHFEPQAARGILRGNAVPPVQGRGRPRRWPPLTPAEHIVLGLRMREATKRAGPLVAAISAIFGTTGRQPQVALAIQARRRIDEMCSRLDIIAHRENPSDDTEFGKIAGWYYGALPEARCQSSPRWK